MSAGESVEGGKVEVDRDLEDVGGAGLTGVAVEGGGESDPSLSSVQT